MRSRPIDLQPRKNLSLGRSADVRQTERSEESGLTYAGSITLGSSPRFLPAFLAVTVIHPLLIHLHLMLQAVLFDLDGTLANTDPIHLKVWREILEPYGYDVDETFFQNHISGRLNEHLIQELLPQLSETEGQQLAANKEAQFRALAEAQLSRMPGFDELYAWIKRQGLKTAVVTNAPRANAEFMLRVLALESAFDWVLIAGDLPRSKPDPLPTKPS